MTEEQAKEVLTQMMTSNPSSFDEAVFGEICGPSELPNWCVCGRCSVLETERMNICCKKENCVTKTNIFKDMCLNENVIEIAGILNYCELFHDSPSFKQSHYRNQSYRFYVLWQYGKLGKGNRVCPPACVVSAIRSKFPSVDGSYSGYDSGDEF
ncbi:hypothetical protein FSP39_014353 [Pinctada imbricata]|uniref:P2X purinoreceptor 7 intracellular domain-containing protein n=1 Tax=Pinctada imbricata TaxID=66713 RepID=A0AA88XI88_PINIB|nr:hypothetical protein FSP39_014353 [Pinctada imbricata]